MKTLTVQEGFAAMRLFLEDYYEQTHSDDIGALLGDLQILEDGMTADPAVWDDWLACVNQVEMKAVA
jgi:hypothetical protein